ncbi:hypothetical protein Cob_v006398 [Colletotrichum orbiculare MAFF 240422]|uniref:Uncharacterized protein n=1 Tax=Colletotrichum orbiculare (strain 104-T / ATCC 96160 / CBS 514.97 / LARS 414 / MAFF 240422) TaxID=1213857 RepID=A0A484FQH8_COLOR|nr:hypothetical protein Cob_v006398 [Colletotrichum orbiculare MAFF 240422]
MYYPALSDPNSFHPSLQGRGKRRSGPGSKRRKLFPHRWVQQPGDWILPTRLCGRFVQSGCVSVLQHKRLISLRQLSRGRIVVRVREERRNEMMSLCDIGRNLEQVKAG